MVLYLVVTKKTSINCQKRKTKIYCLGHYGKKKIYIYFLNSYIKRLRYKIILDTSFWYYECFDPNGPICSVSLRNAPGGHYWKSREHSLSHVRKTKRRDAVIRENVARDIFILFATTWFFSVFVESYFNRHVLLAGRIHHANPAEIFVISHRALQIRTIHIITYIRVFIVFESSKRVIRIHTANVV